MRLTAFSTIFLSITALSACAISNPNSPRLVIVHSTFNEQEAKDLLKPGKGRIEGNAFMRQQGGAVVTCAGSPVRLIPATKYAHDRLLGIYGGIGGVHVHNHRALDIQPNPQTYMELQKGTVCDSRGDFVFENVEAGKFYITVPVQWQAPTYNPITGAGMSLQGGAMMTEVYIQDGETKKIILSK